MKDDWKKWTTRKKVMNFTSRFEYITATDLAEKIEVRLDSLSSLLKKLCDDGYLVRKSGFGPRGGFGYKAKY